MLCPLGHVDRALAAAIGTTSEHLAPNRSHVQKAWEIGYLGGCGPGQQKLQSTLWRPRDFRLDPRAWQALQQEEGNVWSHYQGSWLSLAVGKTLCRQLGWCGGEVVTPAWDEEVGAGCHTMALYWSACKFPGCLLWVCLGAESLWASW